MKALPRGAVLLSVPAVKRITLSAPFRVMLSTMYSPFCAADLSIFIFRPGTTSRRQSNEPMVISRAATSTAAMRRSRCGQTRTPMASSKLRT